MAHKARRKRTDSPHPNSRKRAKRTVLEKTVENGLDNVAESDRPTKVNPSTLPIDIFLEICKWCPDRGLQLSSTIRGLERLRIEFLFPKVEHMTVRFERQSLRRLSIVSGSKTLRVLVRSLTVDMRSVITRIQETTPCSDSHDALVWTPYFERVMAQDPFREILPFLSNLEELAIYQPGYSKDIANSEIRNLEARCTRFTQQMASTLKNCIWSPRRLRILHVDDPAYPLDTPAVIRVETANEMASACDNALTEYALSAEIDPHGAEVDAALMASHCNKMKSLSSLDILLRTREYEAQSVHGYDFSVNFWDNLRCPGITRLQISEMCFKLGSFREALSRLEESLISLHLRLVNFENIEVYNELLWALTGMVALTSLNLSFLNAYDGGTKKGIWFDDKQKTCSWVKESCSITEFARKLSRSKSLTSSAYWWNDTQKD